MPATRSLLAAMVAVVGLSGSVAVDAQEAADPVQPYRDGDRSVVARNILPPGQGGYQSAPEFAASSATGELPDHFTDQVGMYDALRTEYPSLSEDRLGRYFKDASFGVPDDEVVDEYAPRDGVVVRRDTFHVPHVYGTTREDVMFGIGYVQAEDRLFMMDALRHVGRGRASELLGASEGNLAMDRAHFRFADYTEAELEAMALRLEEVDPEIGPVVVADIDAYAAGVNAYIQEALVDPTKLPAEYPALQIVPEPWTRADTVAAATVIGASLGAGGGAELRNAAFLQALEDEGHDGATARAIFDDFRFVDDPEAPVTTTDAYPWMTPAELGPVDPAAVARPDPGSLVVNDPEASLTEVLAGAAPLAADGPFGPIPLRFPDAASNALLVGEELSATGRSFAVYGPQVGYWSPQILMEMDVHGPGVHARGAAFPGLGLYVLLGRGSQYAWSATSAGGDQVDYWAEPLCEPDGSEPTIESQHYIDDDGECVELYTRTDTYVAKPSAGGLPSDPTAEDAVVVTRTTQRTDNGIVHFRATVDGRPVAYVAQRSSYGAEVDSALTYAIIHDPDRVTSVEDLQRAFHRFSYTFNWFLLHGSDHGWVLGGYHPVRASGVDPDLPNWGTGEWNWRSLDLPFDRVPKGLNDERGYVTNWNGKQAPGFRANDGQYSYGPIQRTMMLDTGVERALADDGKITIVELVQAMARAATVDLRGERVLPTVLDVIGRPDDPRLTNAVATLERWIAADAHRLDLDGDGEYEHAAAVALMDAWWDPLLDAIFAPTLGEAMEAVPETRHDRPENGLGSAFNGGWYSHVDKDLRQVLRRPVDGPWSRTYCGDGDPSACRAALLSSLDAAVTALEERFGTDPDGWDAEEETDNITYDALGVQGLPDMAWQNRPTFQQILEFEAVAASEERPRPPADEPPAAPLPATGGGLPLAIAGAVLAAAAATGLRPRNRSGHDPRR